MTAIFRTCLLLSFLCLALPSWGGMAITYVGKTLIADYRSTNISKTLDADGDNVFGTAGYVVYGTDIVGNGNAGSVPATDPLTYSNGTRMTKRSLPAWASLSNNGQGYVANSYDSYPYIDDPAATPGTSVADVQMGFAIRSPNTFGVESSMVNITFGSGLPPGGVRIGVICLASGNDAVDAITLTNNLNAGATTARAGTANPTLYLFDVSGASSGDVVTLRLRKDSTTGGNQNLAYGGLTFDAVPAPAGPPQVNITRPANNAIYAAPLTIFADASDPDTSVTNVAFYLNGQFIGNDVTAPYTLARTNTAPGQHSLVAVATDATGVSATSAVVHITVVDPAGFRITKFGQTNTATALEWQSQPTLRYQLLTATNLTTSDWKPAGTSVVANATLSSAIVAATNEPQRFYRVALDNSTQAASLVTYPLPACYSASAQLSLAVDGTNAPVIDCFTEFRNYDYCNFSCAGAHVITITASEAILSYNISPLVAGITGTVNGRTLTFTLNSPQYLIVKINNLRELVIAADALETNVPPSFGPGIYNVALPPYSADWTGTNLATAPLQNAINDAAIAGGGTVVVPAGVYRCGNLVLQNNVSLYLAGGSVIRGTANPADYTTTFHKASLAADGTWFIYTAANSSNITIYGRGTIDGNGHLMRNSSNYLNNLVVPLQWSHFGMDGVTLRHSGGWACTVTRSDNVLIQNTKHFNNNDLDYENDAIDVQESQNVLVKHTVAVSEDDTYSVKTWTPTTDIAVNWPGASESATNILFDDCFAWSRCGAFKVGQGILQPQGNLTFKNSSVYRCMYAVAVIYKNGTVGASDITFTNLDVEGFWPRSGNSGRWFNAAITTAGSITNLIVANVNVRSPDTTGSVLQGYNATSQFYGLHFKQNYYNGAYGTGLTPLHITNTNSYVTDLTFE